MNRYRWAALTTQAGIGGTLMTRLLRRFGSVEAVFSASSEDLVGVSGVGEKTSLAIQGIPFEETFARLQAFEQQGVAILTWEDPGYPANLLKADDAPPVLFRVGPLASLPQQAVALVGTRTPSPRGAALTFRLGRELAARGWLIVSGLAVGIDTEAHRGALEGGGHTVAVLGGGVLNVYPSRNRGLANQIAAQGALFCEALPDATVSRQGLMARNRITSGLSKAVIVVEAGEDSGSLATARRAAAQGRTVFAVRGGDTGCDGLLAEGAESLDGHEPDIEDLIARLNACTIRVEPPPARLGL